MKLTNKEAIRWFEKQLLCNQTRLATAYFKETFEKAIEALKIAKRFEGAVEVTKADQILMKNGIMPTINEDLTIYAVPKSEDEE